MVHALHFLFNGNQDFSYDDRTCTKNLNCTTLPYFTYHIEKRFK